MTQLGSQGHQGPSNPIFPTIPKSMSDLRGWFNWATQVTNYLRSYVVDFDPPGVVTGFTLSERTIGYQLAWNLVPKARSYSVLRGTTSDPAAAAVITRLVGKDNVSYLDVVDQVTLTSATLYYWVYAENLMGLAGPISEMLTAANKGLVVSARVEVFLESGTWTWIDEGSVLVFVVGGGGGAGGGGGSRGGGGGAGGEVVERIIATNSGDNVTVTIGTGGAGGAGGSGTGSTGVVGVNSSFGTLRARGGNPGVGGAGGGGGSDPGGVGGTAFATGSPFGINAAGGQGGTDGGSSGNDGLTAAGLAAGGSGGTGSSVANQGAGGGGGGSTGAGGNGGNSAADNATAAAVNTGGGGGGGSSNASGAGNDGAAGGSGMCIVISQGTD
jgi:hypothetical protein